MAANLTSMFELDGKRSYSLEAEDLIIQALFPTDDSGFFLDNGRVDDIYDVQHQLITDLFLKLSEL